MSTIKLKLKPFRVPNNVLVEQPPKPRQEGFQEYPSIPLSELDNETLEEMCAEFRKGVFEKARAQNKE